MQLIHWEYGEAFKDGADVKFQVGTKAYGELWAFVDFADWQSISGSRWRATKRQKLFYVRDGSSVLLHRLLTNFKWPVVDHIDGNGLNNRRGNLRRCETNGENNTHAGDRRRGCSMPDHLLSKWMKRRGYENDTGTDK